MFQETRRPFERCPCVSALCSNFYFPTWHLLDNFVHRHKTVINMLLSFSVSPLSRVSLEVHLGRCIWAGALDLEDRLSIALAIYERPTASPAFSWECELNN
jgi:hypothetical protein